MSSLHAIRTERRGLRIMQAKTVMPLIGPLLDAWEGASNDFKSSLRQDEPVLCDYLDKISTAMEDGLDVERDESQFKRRV